MMKWIKKIFDNSKHIKKQTPYRNHNKECSLFIFNTTFEEENAKILSFTPTLTPSMHKSCTCYFCQPIESIRPPSHSQFLKASKNCKKINK
jgi:hypothetical protein